MRRKGPAIRNTLQDAVPRFATQAFLHPRWHNANFESGLPMLPGEQAARYEFATSNRTPWGDQQADGKLVRLYENPAFRP